jgi:hypothetical protein
MDEIDEVFASYLALWRFLGEDGRTYATHSLEKAVLQTESCDYLLGEDGHMRHILLKRLCCRRSPVTIS